MKKNEVEKLIEHGFTLVPCSAVTKIPIPKKWQKYNGTTVKMVEQWYQKYKNICIGIVCGSASKVLVLDIDSQEAMDELCRYGSIPKTPFVKTKHGWHFYFELPEGNASRTRRGLIKDVDIRCVGGYAIAPGSILKNGARYDWQLTPDDCDYAEVPSWLVELCAKKTRKVKKKKEWQEDGIPADPKSIILPTLEQMLIRAFRNLSKIKRAIVSRDMEIDWRKTPVKGKDAFNVMFRQRGCPIPYIYTERKAKFLRKAGQAFLIHYGVLLSNSKQHMERLGRQILRELKKQGIGAQCHNFQLGRIVVTPNSVVQS